MKILVIGSGGREHALCQALLRDPGVDAVVAAPGNAGIAATVQCVPVAPTDPAAVTALARRAGSELVVIGPEAPLVAGVADAVRAAGIACFGPSAAAARIEGSKAYAKDVMAAAGVPTAMARVGDDEAEVAAALDAFGPPYVVKDDGLAGGKGVVVTADRAAALAHAKSCGRVLIEEYLDGPEVSVFGITDGRTVLALEPAQDFKPVGDGDTGPNTGGMGAYSPLPWAPSGLVEEVLARVLEPTVAELARRGEPFTGLLYAGLALSARGLRVVEFNARFGDPETQVVLARLRTPLGGLLHAAATGTLAETEPPRWHPGAAVTVVLAAPGYPAEPRLGDPVRGLDAPLSVPGVEVLHAGTAVGPDGDPISTGGRVLAVTATGADLEQARRGAYAGLAGVDLPGRVFRRDIARSAVFAGLYRDARARVGELARALSGDQLTTPVAATPAWTVRDLLAHLVGVAADNAPGAEPVEAAPGSETWTARHVQARRDVDIDGLIAEWDRAGAAVELGLAARRMPVEVVQDLLVHEGDLRETLGRTRPPAAGWEPAARIALSWVQRQYPGPGTVMLRSGGEAWGAEATVELSGDLYELYRAVFSRRSTAQLRAMITAGAEPAATAVLQALPVFGAREDDQPLPTDVEEQP